MLGYHRSESTSSLWEEGGDREGPGRVGRWIDCLARYEGVSSWRRYRRKKSFHYVCFVPNFMNTVQRLAPLEECVGRCLLDLKLMTFV